VLPMLAAAAAAAVVVVVLAAATLLTATITADAGGLPTGPRGAMPALRCLG
jgi:hypothetical protein